MRRFVGLLLVCSLLPARFVAQGEFDILRGLPSATIPFQYANNFILVEVRLFGMLPMTFIFDTGAEHTILFHKEFADIFNTEYDLRVPIIGSDLSREVYALVARSVDIEVKGLEPVQRDILVLEEDYLTLDEITGRPIHGILGSSFFKNAVVQIDFKKQRIVLHNSATFKPPAGNFQEYDVTVRSGKPYVHGSISLRNDTTVDVTLLVDTGAGLPMLLHNNTSAKLSLPDHYILGRLGLGLGGLVEGYLGRIQVLHLGKLTFRDVLTSFQDLSNSILADSTRFRNGLIGTQLLTRFEIYIDFMNEKMYLRPLRNYKRKFRMDKSGLIIFATGEDLDVYVVQDIIADSPATAEDIRPGDVIKKVQGFPANMYSLDSLLRLLQKRDGKKVRLVIKRKQEILKKRIRLKELI